MQFWRRQIAVHGDNAWMRSYIIRLYVIIFEMYADIFVEWSSSKWDRLKGSFDRSFFDKKVSSKRTEMRELEHNLEREAKLSTEARIQELPTRILQQVSLLLEAKLGPSVQSHLREIAYNQLRLVTHSQNVLTVRPTLPADETAIPNDTIGDEMSLYPTTALKNIVPASTLEMQETTIVNWMAQASTLSIDNDAHDTLQRWINGDEKRCIWIEGPYIASSPSESSLMSAALIAVARQSAAQSISYFCTEAAVKSDYTEFQSNALQKMVYSFIGQLVALLPDGLEQPTGLLESQIRSLEKSTASVSQAIEVLRTLMSQRPPVLICLVDGIQVLEDRGNPSQMVQLRQIVDLLAPQDAVAPEKAVRTCFTTDGTSDVLAELVGKGTVAKIEYDTEFQDLIGVDGIDVSML